MTPDSLSKVIHERVRLAVMAALARRRRLNFNELKELLEVSDGNLSVHTRVLEEHGFVRVQKEFRGRKPCTTFSITPEGRREFKRYVDQHNRNLPI